MPKGTLMKTLILVVLAFVLSLPSIAWAQDNSQSGQGQSGQGQMNPQSGQPSSQTSQTNQNTQGGQNMSGTVSRDRKTFTSDKDSKSYRVNNPQALKGYEGQHVAVLVSMDPDTGDIHITQIEAPPQQ
jgi:cytoskeletal protein RodZ